MSPLEVQNQKDSGFELYVGSTCTHNLYYVLKVLGSDEPGAIRLSVPIVQIGLN